MRSASAHRSVLGSSHRSSTTASRKPIPSSKCCGRTCARLMKCCAESFMQTRPSNYGAAADLRQECRLFTRYLVDRDPDPYVVEWYIRLQRVAFDGTTVVAPPDA